jgi:single-strand DNA-binding protein
MINRLVIKGRLVHAPELKYLQDGTPVAKFSLAVNRGSGDKKEAMYLDVTCWRNLAETVANNLDKGRTVTVDGRLWVRTYEAKDGGKGKAVEITADSVDFEWPKDDNKPADDLEGLD